MEVFLFRLDLWKTCNGGKDNMNIKKIIENIKKLSGYTSYNIIDKGWSDDIKIQIIYNDKVDYLLRLADIKHLENKKKEYGYQVELSKYDIPIATPIDFGITYDNLYVYQLYKWIIGEDAEEVITNLSEKEQYNLGYINGKKLKIIHDSVRNIDYFDFGAKYQAKIERKINDYQNCGVKFEYDKEVIRYLHENKSIIKDRPVCFQHGDYHIGNMIYNDNKLWIIDFNRCSIGDPWEEFDRNIFSKRKSKYFAIGQIHGYFNSEIPDLFFRVMSIYNATNLLSAIPWSIPFGKKDVLNMLENASEIYKDYNGFKSYIPIWYIRPVDIVFKKNNINDKNLVEK